MKSQPLAREEEGEKEEDDAEVDQSKFAFAVTRIAVAQICQSVGFRSTQRSALHTLTDVAAGYLRAVAGSAAASATSTGRTQSNLYDVVRALEDLGSVQGFRGASNPNQSLLESSTLTDLSKFVRYTDEIPFAKPIPPRPPLKRSDAPPADGLRTADFFHISRWLPAIPDMGVSKIERKEEIQEEEKNGIGIEIGIGIGIEIEIDSCGGVDGNCLVGEKMRMGLPEKRPRVRFKLDLGKGGSEVGMGMREVLVGVDLRNGVCRGGKRVSCQNWMDEGHRMDEEIDHRKKKKNKCSSFSKRPP